MRDLATGNCVDCATSDIIETRESECHACHSASDESRYWDEASGQCYLWCTESNQFHDSNGQCQSCASSSPIQSTEVECGKCSGNWWWNGVCAEPCTSGSTFHNASYECVPCSTESDVIGLSESECLACGNREWDSENNICFLHVESGCDAGMFKGANDVCYDCSDLNKYAATQAQCHMCDSTEYKRKMIGENCALTTCPAGYFQGSGGACIPCGEIRSYKSDETSCAVCNNTDVPRYYDGINCRLLDTDCSNGFVSSSICHLCTDSGSYSTSPSECEKCPNRHRLNS